MSFSSSFLRQSSPFVRRCHFDLFCFLGNLSVARSPFPSFWLALLSFSLLVLSFLLVFPFNHKPKPFVCWFFSSAFSLLSPLPPPPGFASLPVRTSASCFFVDLSLSSSYPRGEEVKTKDREELFSRRSEGTERAISKCRYHAVDREANSQTLQHTPPVISRGCSLSTFLSFSEGFFPSVSFSSFSFLRSKDVSGRALPQLGPLDDDGDLGHVSVDFSLVPLCAFFCCLLGDSFSLLLHFESSCFSQIFSDGALDLARGRPSGLPFSLCFSRHRRSLRGDFVPAIPEEKGRFRRKDSEIKARDGSSSIFFFPRPPPLPLLPSSSSPPFFFFSSSRCSSSLRRRFLDFSAKTQRLPHRGEESLSLSSFRDV